MKVLFYGPTENDWRHLRSLVNGLTSDPDSVRVFAEEQAERLVAEFRMPTKAQHKAVAKIARVLWNTVANRQDSAIGFPRSSPEDARVRRKNKRPKAQR